MKIEGGRVDIGFVSLSDLVMQADEAKPEGKADMVIGAGDQQIRIKRTGGGQGGMQSAGSGSH